MNDIEKYIHKTRGCTLPMTEESDTCMSCSYDIKHSFDWGEFLLPDIERRQYVVVRFKSGRKAVFENHEKLFLKKGDVVAVEAATGHDIGVVDLTGETAYWQALKQGIKDDTELPKVYRKARAVDIEKWKDAVAKENAYLKRTREIIQELGLEMKLGDVEIQGDASKATFYYTADDRVDFRELIKILAQEFKIRIEMRQIGARQESARIGGIGACGMELCCIRWKKDFESVTTNSARYQELSLNPTKLAGQCGKLKCCLNYEVEAYIEARKSFPDTSVTLKTKEGNAYYQKSDVFKQILWYSSDPENSVNITSLTIQRVNEIIEMNKRGEIPDSLQQNKIELVDLISNKHNVSITTDDIVDSKDDGGIMKKRRKNYRNKNNKNRKRRYNNKNSNNNNKRNSNPNNNKNSKK